LFVSGKRFNTVKCLRDIVVAAYEIRNQQEIIDDTKFDEIGKQVMSYARTIVSTLNNELTVELPYKSLVEYIRRVNGRREIAQAAWNFVNDSFR
jgi:cyclin T